MAQIKLNQSQFTALSANASFSFSTDRRFAKENPDKTFLVTKLGSSLAGYSTEEIAGLFKKLEKFIPENVILPKEYDPRYQTLFELDQSTSQYSPSIKMYEGFIKLNHLNQRSSRDLVNGLKINDIILDKKFDELSNEEVEYLFKIFKENM